MQMQDSEDYHTSIVVQRSPKASQEAIGHVSEWWAKNVTGSSVQSGDEFTVQFGDTFVKFKVSEYIPGRKVVWEVLDCNLHWLPAKDRKEWKGTQVVWEIRAQNGGSKIEMTHVGITPQVVCYADCKLGWDGYVQQSLYKLLTDGEGMPEQF